MIRINICPSRYCCRLFLLIFGLWMGGSCVLLWLSSSSLLHPHRSSVAPNLNDWFNHADRHGIIIAQGACANGLLPCLLVTPHQPTKRSERGLAIHQQLQEKGYIFPETVSRRGILVLLHGRGGRKENMLPIAERFSALGFYCVLPDLPAHGDSPVNRTHFGAGNNEAEWINQALTDARLYFNEPDIPAGIWGISMGGAFANAAVAAEPENWSSMIIVASFDRLSMLVKHQLRWLPHHVASGYQNMFRHLLIYRDSFDINDVRPDLWAKNIPIPILVVHGSTDTVIRPERGFALYESYPIGQKAWLEIPGGNHGNVLITDYPTYASMGEWFLKNMPEP